MIVALEGPDGCGKSSLFQALLPLKLGVYVPARPVSPKMLSCMAEVDRWDLDLWRALYDPARLYVCDRHVAVSSRVYGLLYNRSVPDSSFFEPEIHVIYLEANEELLKERLAVRGDDTFDPKKTAAAISAYEQVLPKFRVTRLHADYCINDLVRGVELAICS